MHRAAGDPGDPGGNVKTFRRAGMALLAAAGLLLGPAVVNVPASAEDATVTDPTASDSTVIDVPNPELKPLEEYLADRPNLRPDG